MAKLLSSGVATEGIETGAPCKLTEPIPAAPTCREGGRGELLASRGPDRCHSVPTNLGAHSCWLLAGICLVSFRNVKSQSVSRETSP